MKKSYLLFFMLIIIFLFEACHATSFEEPANNILINEILTQNTRTAYDKDYYKFSDWIELFNPTNRDLNLSGYVIIGGKKDTKYIFPSSVVIPASSYLLVWADKENNYHKEVHLNFKLPSDGGEITLLSPNGNVVDYMEYGEQKRDISFGRAPNVQINGYMTPTPRVQNSFIFNPLKQTPPPSFSIDSGFYDLPIVVSFEQSVKDTTIYYTLDGTMPTEKSLRYIEPFLIEKTAVVSAVAYSNNALPSNRVNRSYFIKEKTSLPIISMIIEPRFLYDDEIGIYTVGTNGADVFSWCGGPSKANYFQDWERAAYLEYFQEDKILGFSLLAGIKIAGFCTQVLPQKSFTIKMKSKYGQESLKYKLFKDREIEEFKYFSLRNAGNDWCNAMLRDAFMQRSCEVMGDLSPQAYQPILLFLNGQYWGIYNIREKINQTFLQSHYDVKKVDLLENNMTVKAGSAKEYSELLDYIDKNDLSNDDNYEYVRSKIDIDQFIDYYISEIYFANNDWPGNNMLYWKDKENKDAKWRWILHDTDFGFDLQHKNGIEFNMLDMVTSSSGEYWPNPPWSTFLLRNLLHNETFKNYFIERSMMQLENVFKAERMKSILESIALVIEPEIQRQYDRWSSVDMPADVKEKYPTFKSIHEWYDELERMKHFADYRNCFVKKHFGEMFNFVTSSCKNE